MKISAILSVVGVMTLFTTGSKATTLQIQSCPQPCQQKLKSIPLTAKGDCKGCEITGGPNTLKASPHCTNCEKSTIDRIIDVMATPECTGCKVVGVN